MASSQLSSSSAVTRRSRPGAGRSAASSGRARSRAAAARVVEQDPRPAEADGDPQTGLGIVDAGAVERGVDRRAFGGGDGHVRGLAGTADLRGDGVGDPRDPVDDGVRGDVGGARPRPPGRRRRRGRCRAGGSGWRPSPPGSTVTSERSTRRSTTSSADAAGTSSAARTCSTAGMRGPAGELGERPEAALVVGEEQVVAPGQRRGEGAAALGSAGGGVGEQGEAVVEPLRRSRGTVRIRARAAASSIASGRQSRARHSCATSGAVSAVRVNDGRRSAARCANSVDCVGLRQRGEHAHHLAVEPERPLARGEHPHPRSGVEHLRRRARRPASARCSQLSRTSSRSAPRSPAATSGLPRRPRDGVGERRRQLGRGPDALEPHQPHAVRGAGDARATSVARRVLPTPAGPTSVTSRWASQARRQRGEVVGAADERRGAARGGSRRPAAAGGAGPVERRGRARAPAAPAPPAPARGRRRARRRAAAVTRRCAASASDCRPARYSAVTSSAHSRSRSGCDRDERLQLADDLAGGAEREPRGELVLDQPQPGLLQPHPVRQHPAAAPAAGRTSGPNSASPARQVAAAAAASPAASCAAPAVGEPQRLQRVDAARLDDEGVARGAAGQRGRVAEGPAQLGDLGLQRVAPGARRVGPQVLERGARHAPGGRRRARAAPAARWSARSGRRRGHRRAAPRRARAPRR